MRLDRSSDWALRIILLMLFLNWNAKIPNRSMYLQLNLQDSFKLYRKDISTIWQNKWTVSADAGRTKKWLIVGRFYFFWTAESHLIIAFLDAFMKFYSFYSYEICFRTTLVYSYCTFLTETSGSSLAAFRFGRMSKVTCSKWFDEYIYLLELNNYLLTFPRS